MDFAKDLLAIKDMTAEEIEFILDNALSMKSVSERDIKKVPTLRGKTIINLFFEPSTRTRTSFEIAGKRLSADVINISASSSSVVKGESFKDTLLNIQAMAPDIVVVRHPSSGAAEFSSRVLDCNVVNAGDGSHEHPTQALLDIFTIREKKKKLEGLQAVIIGDIAHSRVARSNISAMNKLGIKVRVCAPPTLLPKNIENLEVTVTTDLKQALKGADVIMPLRLQMERQGSALLPSLREYAMRFCITEASLTEANPGFIIMHPGPVNRGIEISGEIVDGPFSVILNQVTNGVAIRMAVLHLLGGVH